jgi:hypothetical protein
MHFGLGHGGGGCFFAGKRQEIVKFVCGFRFVGVRDCGEFRLGFFCRGAVFFEA